MNRSMDCRQEAIHLTRRGQREEEKLRLNEHLMTNQAAGPLSLSLSLSFSLCLSFSSSRSLLPLFALT